MKFSRYLIALFLVQLFLPILAGCGGSGGTDPAVQQVPIQVSISNQDLTAGLPAAFSYTIPAQSTPYTSITIDLTQTLQSATISVTP